MNIPINHDAPVKSEAMIYISAPVHVVWGVLTTIGDWPNWQADVTESALQGELKEGAEFKWKAGGIRFTSQIHTMVETTMFGWTGKTFGAFAIHNWTLEERNGDTSVRVEESLEGWLPGLFTNFFQKNLDMGVKKNLEELRSAAQKNLRE